MKVFNNCFAASADGGRVISTGGFGHTVQLSNDSRSMFSFLISIGAVVDYASPEMNMNS